MKIFIDTAPFIYLIEDHPVFAVKVKQVITQAIVNNDPLVTSIITYMEFGVKPEKAHRQDLIRNLDELMERLNIDLLNADKEAAKQAYQLRAKYDFLRGMDALQVGIAMKEGCQLFITNDKKLKKIAEIPVRIIEEL